MIQLVIYTGVGYEPAYLWLSVDLKPSMQIALYETSLDDFS